MIRKILFTLLIIFTVNLYSQRNDILTNDTLIIEYIEEFVKEGENRNLDIKSDLANNIDYIMIVPDSIKVDGLGASSKHARTILISSKVRIDRIILKVVLYRELSYMLGVPYGGNIIMDRKRDEWFTYSSLADPEIMSIEMGRIMDLYGLQK